MSNLQLAAFVLSTLALACSAIAQTPVVDGSLKPARLRVEHLVEPLGVDITQPRFGWEVSSTARGDRQTAYQVIVGNDRAAVEAGALWDTGRVESSETIGLMYAGKPLTAHQRLWWAVRVWDKDNRASAWSTPAMFSTGFIGDAKWDAPWIGYDAARNEIRSRKDPLADAKWIMSADDDVKNAAKATRLYLADVELPADVRVASAVLYASADNHLRIAVNGQEVAKTAGKDAWKNVQTIDVTRALRGGKNLLRAQVDNETPGPTGLLAKLIVTLGDGRVIEHTTGDAWRSLATVPDDWTQVPMDAAAAVRVIGGNGVEPWGTLRATPIVLPPVPMLRKPFAVTKELRRATLYAAELGNADFYLNGKRVTDDRYTSGWTDYSKRVYYRAFDVTGRVKQGDNVIGAMLADGWFSGYVGYAKARDHYGKDPRLSTELRLEYADGSIESVKSDASWKATESATREADFLLGEVFDARVNVEGWSVAGFDDRAWKPVDVGSEEVKPLVQWHPAQPVREFETIKPKKITEPTPGAYVLDLGQNFAGVARLKIENAQPGQKIVMRFAERLNPDGTIYTTNLRFARATDVYICKGGGAETWEPRFTFHGYQYIEITGLTSPPTPDTITGVAFSSDTPIVGTFETSDAMLNRLHANILYTQRANFIDIPTDCPQRDERLGWTADAQVYLNAAILNADVQPFFGKWLVDLADAQRADGQFPMVAPLKVAESDGGPAWADAGTICPWTLYEAYGDKHLLARQYPSMKKFVEFCRERTGDDLLPPEKFHAFGDWLSINAETPKDVIYMAYFAHSTKLTANAARALGHEADAKAYDELFERIKQSFHTAYISEDGRIKGDTQTCYVLAIAFDLVDGSKRDAAARHLVENIEQRGGHLSTGFLGTKELMLVLSDIGRSDVAFRLIHNETFPSWGFSIKHGATSIWERWDGWTPEQGFQDPGMNSFSHYSFGAVYQWMVENIGGIHALKDAARTITIAPQIDPKLTWAKVGYHGPRGEIRSDWRVEGDQLKWSVQVPANVTATLIVPAATDAKITEGGEPLGEAAGIEIVEERASGTVLKVGGGDYVFEAIVKR